MVSELVGTPVSMLRAVLVALHGMECKMQNLRFRARKNSPRAQNTATFAPDPTEGLPKMPTLGGSKEPRTGPSLPRTRRLRVRRPNSSWQRRKRGQKQALLRENEPPRAGWGAYMVGLACTEPPLGVPGAAAVAAAAPSPLPLPPSAIF